MKVHRHSLIFGLSYALDIAGNNNRSHSKSTAYLAVSIGRELGLSEDKLRALNYASLLHDIGVSNEYMLYQHCKTGSEMLKKLPLEGEISEFVLYHHEFWDGSGLFGLIGDEIPLCSQIICFASSLDDRFGGETERLDHSVFLEIEAWKEKKKELFSREIREAFDRLTIQEAFLLDYFNQETKYLLSEKMVIGDDVYFDYEDVLRFALCFADIIDQRSPFTTMHSFGIAKWARHATAYLGYDSEAQNKMYIAGLLHDIGKLNVSTAILHKNGKLTTVERFEINKHTYYTRRILEQIRGFEDIVDYAANHHEKVDGTGYPYRIPGSRLSDLEKVMAICDVYQALTEERPYRPRMPEEKVWQIIDDMVEHQHLDGALIEKIRPIFAEDF